MVVAESQWGTAIQVNYTSSSNRIAFRFVDIAAGCLHKSLRVVPSIGGTTGSASDITAATLIITVGSTAAGTLRKLDRHVQYRVSTENENIT